MSGNASPRLARSGGGYSALFGPSGLSDSTFQPPVLFRREVQEYPTAPHLNPMKHRQTGFLVRESSGAFNQFDQLVGSAVFRSCSRNWHCQPLRHWKDKYTR